MRMWPLSLRLHHCHLLKFLQRAKLHKYNKKLVSAQSSVHSAQTRIVIKHWANVELLTPIKILKSVRNELNFVRLRVFYYCKRPVQFKIKLQAQVVAFAINIFRKSFVPIGRNSNSSSMNCLAKRVVLPYKACLVIFNFLSVFPPSHW